MSLGDLVASILLVGHTLLAAPLPEMIQGGLAQSGQVALVQTQVIEAGTLRQNWQGAERAQGVNGRALLASGQVTDLILAESPVVTRRGAPNPRASGAGQWARAAREANPETRVWLLEGWNEPGADLSAWRVQLRANLAHWRAIAGKEMTLIPAAQALADLSLAIEAGELPGLASIHDLFADGGELTPHGAYFVAMVSLAALTQVPVEGLPAQLTAAPSGNDPLTEEQAIALQRIAWESVAVHGPIALALAGQDARGVTPILNPNLGFGLAPVNDWSPQQPFLDVMKTARPWIGHLPGRWGGWEEADLRAVGALDDEGWPRRIPPQLTGLTTLVLTDLPPDAGGVAGRYVLSYEGRGQLTLSGRAQMVERRPGRIVFDYQPGQGSVVLTLSRTDESNPLRRIRIIREAHLARAEEGAIFNPDWLARIRGARLLRFMDWLAVNDSPLSRAGERPRPQDYSWARRGVPIEIIAALANELGADPWITLPHLAEEALITDWARVMARELRPERTLWLEFSNEVWNMSFAQAHWAEAEARRRWGREGAGVQFYRLRAAEVMRIWAASFPRARLKRVIAGQTGWLGREADILEPPLLSGHPPVAEDFDVWAITGYVSGKIGSRDKAGMVEAWLRESEAAAARKSGHRDFIAAHRHDLAIELAAREIRDGSLSGDAGDTLRHLVEDIFPYHAQVARRHGLTLAMYEGGSHVVGLGELRDDPDLTAFLTAFNYSPAMGEIYADLLRAWARVSEAPFMAYVDVQVPGKWGSWGALRHLGDDNPRWRALAEGCGPC